MVAEITLRLATALSLARASRRPGSLASTMISPADGVVVACRGDGASSPRTVDGATFARAVDVVARPPSPPRSVSPRRRRGHRRRRRVVVARRGPHEALLPRGHGLRVAASVLFHEKRSGDDPLWVHRFIRKCGTSQTIHLIVPFRGPRFFHGFLVGAGPPSRIITRRRRRGARRLRGLSQARALLRAELVARDGRQGDASDGAAAASVTFGCPGRPPPTPSMRRVRLEHVLARRADALISTRAPSTPSTRGRSVDATLSEGARARRRRRRWGCWTIGWRAPGGLATPGPSARGSGGCVRARLSWGESFGALEVRRRDRAGRLHPAVLAQRSLGAASQRAGCPWTSIVAPALPPI